MIKKLILFCLTLLLFLSTTTIRVFAGGFNLKSIGQLDTSGREISHWWYSGSSAVMKGEAIASSTVTISIDGNEVTTTTDGNGNWTYTPASLTDGDHTIILTNSGSTIKFTLTMGATNVDWDIVGKESSTSALPAAGVTFPTILLLAFGAGFVLIGRKLAKTN